MTFLLSAFPLIKRWWWVAIIILLLSVICGQRLIISNQKQLIAKQDYIIRSAEDTYNKELRDLHAREKLADEHRKKADQEIAKIERMSFSDKCEEAMYQMAEMGPRLVN